MKEKKVRGRGGWCWWWWSGEEGGLANERMERVESVIGVNVLRVRGEG